MKWPSSAHEATRFILGRLPDCTPVDSALPEAERFPRGDEVPQLLPPSCIEGESLEAIEVADPRTVRGESGFTGFLDGTQDVRVVNHVHGIPIVWATVSAAVRARANRRLVSWKESAPMVRRGYYLPFRYIENMDPELATHPHVIDTAGADRGGKVPSRHPAALMEAAFQCVQHDRELIETHLAELWCARERGTLFVDGSISGSRIVAASPRAIGVVKSHRRLYADGGAFRVVVGLRAGERTSIFRMADARNAVASWYVRIRPAAGRDALFGLVRVEAALENDMTARANEITRWIIAEGAPLALPDGRWDKMAYGIRDTEEFLRAIS